MRKESGERELFAKVCGRTRLLPVVARQPEVTDGDGGRLQVLKEEGVSWKESERDLLRLDPANVGCYDNAHTQGKITFTYIH